VPLKINQEGEEIDNLQAEAEAEAEAEVVREGNLMLEVEEPSEGLSLANGL
jgi:hypothetical protein